MFCSSPGQTYFISLFSSEIRTALALSHGELGTIYSLATMCSALALLRTGSLIDKFAAHKIVIVVLVLLAAAGGFLALTSNIAMLFVAFFLLRQLGQGLTSMTASTTMMRYLPDSKGKANALSNMGYSASEAVMPSLIVFLIASFSWRLSWLYIGLALLIIAPCLSLLVRSSDKYRTSLQLHTNSNTSTQKTTGSIRQWTRSEVIRDPFFYLFIPGLMSNSMLYTGFMFHQVHLVESKGWSLPLWGSLYIIFAITTIITTLSIGNWADQIGAIKIAPWVTLPVGIGLLLLSSTDATWVAAAFMILMAFSTGAQGALSGPFFAERYGTQHFASIKSLAAFAMIIMTASSPIVIGWLIDYGMSIDALAVGGALYAFIASTISGIAYRALQRQNEGFTR